MKTISTLAVAAMLIIAVASSVFAQGRPVGPPVGAGGGVAHLTEVYAKLTPFDSNNDGALDKNEQATLIAAMASGAVKAPFHQGPPAGVNPSAEQIAGRIAAVYATVAPYDANADGTLDASEQAAIQADIVSGKLRRPGGPPR